MEIEIVKPELTAIQSKIYEIRDMKVMLDIDLAKIYGVETRILNQSVKRNSKRFPTDFMFQLTNQELSNLMSQIVTSSWGGIRKLPYAFTEHGVTMLSGILNSDTAIEMNIAIVRAFIEMRQYVLNYKEINRKLEDYIIKTDIRLCDIDNVLVELITKKRELEKPSNPIGFKPLVKE